MDEAERMVEHAKLYLASACDNLLHRGREAVAFDEARHAAEIAGKALFLKKTGRPMGKMHAIAGRLAHEGLIPHSLDPKALSDLLNRHTRGAYGFFEEIPREDVRLAIQAAEALIAAARKWPDAGFHAPRPPTPPLEGD